MGWRSPLSSTFLFFLPTRLTLPAFSCRLSPVDPRAKGPFSSSDWRDAIPPPIPSRLKSNFGGGEIFQQPLPDPTYPPVDAIRQLLDRIAAPVPPMLEIASPSRSCPPGGKLTLERKGSSHQPNSILHLHLHMSLPSTSTLKLSCSTSWAVFSWLLRQTRICHSVTLVVDHLTQGRRDVFS
ncbi:hypothetical protein CEP51_016833 [Fusarium floridanum]|uniref:Uncharacterized protein n=1 Tax=Fusarium floridanum TaxID=1325733 RepID=A0A428NEM6_9HYPO|nr:hypothetical protein CEP51_016833 [Fusarium floridanum]